MHEPLDTMLFPPLGARMSGSESRPFSSFGRCFFVQTAPQMVESGGEKVRLSLLVEAVFSRSRSRLGAV